MVVDVDDGNFCNVVCEPVVAVWLPVGQLAACELHVSCHVSVALSVSGFAFAKSAGVTLWNASGVAVVNDEPGGNVQRLCPTLQLAPPLNDRFKLGNTLVLTSSPLAPCTVSTIDVIVSVSGSLPLLTVKLHLVICPTDVGLAQPLRNVSPCSTA